MSFTFSKPSDKSYDYRLGTHADQMEEPELRAFLQQVYESDSVIRLKRISEGERDRYADVIASSGAQPTATMRRQVGKVVASTGDLKYDDGSGEKPFENVKQFIDVVPLAIIIDIHYEIAKVPTAGN